MNMKIRLGKAAREFNVGINTLVEFLAKKGYDISTNPNTRLEPEMYELLADEFQAEKKVKELAHQKELKYIGKKETVTIDEKTGEEEKTEPEEPLQDELFIKQTNVEYNSDQPKASAGTPKEVKPVEEKEKPQKVPVTVEKTEKSDTEKQVEVKESQKKKEEEKVVEKVETGEQIAGKEEIKEEKITGETERKEEIKVEEKITEKTQEQEPETELKKEEKETIKPPKVLDKINLDEINQKTRPPKKSKAQRKKEAEQKRKEEKTEQKQTDATKQETTRETVEKPAEIKEEKVAATEKPEVAKEQPAAEKEPVKKNDENFIPTDVEKLTGPKILDKIELPETGRHGKKKKPVASSSDNKVGHNKKKRRRIKTESKPVKTDVKGEAKTDKKNKKKANRHKPVKKVELSEEEIQKQIKETLARLAPTGKSKAAKHRREKRKHVSHQMEEELKRQQEEQHLLKVTEFVTANELANLMDINVTEVIKTCLQLGLFVSINQRLDAETIVLVAEEYGYKVEFVDVDDHESLEVEEVEDNPEDLVERPPIVTVMGHVDHGKTKLLDYIRKANVVAGEAGGITQHIGAYEVRSESGKKITFLDTPGHEAFTAMRARGAKVTDVAIIVIAADDSVMPQTKEAINHAQAAGVPIVFAINKIDKPNANPDKIKEQLANMNILVEEWGGKFQSQDISAVTGQGIQDLLEKVLLEAELLELRANPNKPGKGTVLEASLDKGRGYVANILVQDGTVKKGDVILAGPVHGKVKAMFNEFNKQLDQAGPSTPVLLLGLTGAPQAGDVFNVMKNEKEAKQLAAKRQQLIREQSLRAQKHITLDEIGRRIAIGSFKELNIIVKGDVDGSIEALSDALLKLSTDEVQVNVIHKAVGAITESDIMLASASDAIIIGFQVRPVPQARKLAEQEQIDIRIYSIIYQATEELKAAIEGMLEPKVEEKVVCNVEVRDVFKISKVGTVAGCYVLDGKITRNTKIRLIRDGIVVYTGNLGSLKRFKDDVKEVPAGYECGLNIENFNDVKVGDIIEGYEVVEVKRK
jgi:translation initiation factor IF-2